MAAPSRRDQRESSESQAATPVAGTRLSVSEADPGDQGPQILLGILAVFLTASLGLVNIADYVDKRRNAIVWDVFDQNVNLKQLGPVKLVHFKHQLAKEWFFGYILAILLVFILFIIGGQLSRQLPERWNRFEFRTPLFGLSVDIPLSKWVKSALYTCLLVWIIALFIDGVDVIRALI